MQLVFLGIRSPAFPLSLWILGAIAAGIITTLLTSGLFRLTHFTARRQGRKRARSFEQPSSRTYSYTQAPPREAASGQSQSTAKRTSAEEEDASDWFDDDSSWEDEPIDAPQDRSRTSYSEPTQSSSRSSSSYSYSYRDPKDTRAEPPKPVVDADYRVIVPPHRSVNSNNVNLNNTDSFEDDDRP